MIENIYQKERCFYKEYSSIVDFVTGKTLSAIYKTEVQYSDPEAELDLDLEDYDTLLVFEIENRKYIVQYFVNSEGNKELFFKEIDELCHFEEIEYLNDEDVSVLIRWAKVPNIPQESVRMVAPFYDEYSESACGFTLIFENCTYSFEMYYGENSYISYMIYEDAPCPRYIYRKKSRAMFTAMFDFVNEETERLRLRKLSGRRFALEYNANMYNNKYVRSLYGIKKLGFSYSPNPPVSEMIEIIVEMYADSIACPPEYVERFCELICSDKPECFRCPIKEYCNQGKI